MLPAICNVLILFVRLIPHLQSELNARNVAQISGRNNITEMFLMENKMDYVVKGPHQVTFDLLCYKKSEALVVVYYLLNGFLSCSQKI